MHTFIYKYDFLHFRISLIFDRFVAKLGPGSVAILVGIVFSSILKGSNFIVISYYPVRGLFWFQKFEPKQ